MSQAPAASLRHHALLRLWAQVLDTLARDPGELIGRLDWVSKRYLLETAGASEPPAVQKKIDLRYHELGIGYHAWMVERGLAVELVGAREIAQAIEQPPERSPARLRGTLIRELADNNVRAKISWDSVYIDAPDGRRIIRLIDR